MKLARFGLLVMVAACAHRGTLRQDFQERLDDSLAELPPLPAAWPADATAWIADDVLRGTLDAAVHDVVFTRSFSLAGMSATPRLALTELKVGQATRPAVDTLGLVARLDGDVGFNVFGGVTQIGLVATLKIDASIDVVSDGDALSLVAKPVRVNDVRVAWDGAPAWAISALPLPMLTSWLTEKALTAFPAVTVAQFGGKGLPVRDLRVQAMPGGLKLEARTAAPLTLAVGAVTQPEHGWTVRVPVDTVMQLARRQLFQQGPVDHDVWIDPVSLKLGDGTFALKLRLWRVVGAPWWREIEIHGALAVNRQKIVLRADEAVEMGHSNGAGLADPLIAIAKGRVLDAIAEAATISVPTTQAAALGSTPTAWRIRELWVDGTDLVITGDAAFGDDAKKPDGR